VDDEWTEVFSASRSSFWRAAWVTYRTFYSLKTALYSVSPNQRGVDAHLVVARNKEQAFAIAGLENSWLSSAKRLHEVQQAPAYMGLATSREERESNG
jgi:hypothetical protein